MGAVVLHGKFWMRLLFGCVLASEQASKEASNQVSLLLSSVFHLFLEGRDGRSEL